MEENFSGFDDESLEIGQAKHPSPVAPNPLNTLESEPWFVKGWTSEQTKTKLMTMQEGDFLVRESESKVGA